MAQRPFHHAQRQLGLALVRRIISTLSLLVAIVRLRAATTTIQLAPTRRLADVNTSTSVCHRSDTLPAKATAVPASPTLNQHRNRERGVKTGSLRSGHALHQKR